MAAREATGSRARNMLSAVAARSPGLVMPGTPSGFRQLPKDESVELVDEAPSGMQKRTECSPERPLRSGCEARAPPDRTSRPRNAATRPHPRRNKRDQSQEVQQTELVDAPAAAGGAAGATVIESPRWGELAKEVQTISRASISFDEVFKRREMSAAFSLDPELVRMDASRVRRRLKAADFMILKDDSTAMYFWDSVTVACLVFTALVTPCAASCDTN